MVDEVTLPNQQPSNVVTWSSGGYGSGTSRQVLLDGRPWGTIQIPASYAGREEEYVRTQIPAGYLTPSQVTPEQQQQSAQIAQQKETYRLQGEERHRQEQEQLKGNFMGREAQGRVYGYETQSSPTDVEAAKQSEIQNRSIGVEVAKSAEIQVEREITLSQPGEIYYLGNAANNYKGNAQKLDVHSYYLGSIQNGFKEKSVEITPQIPFMSSVVDEIKTQQEVQQKEQYPGQYDVKSSFFSPAPIEQQLHTEEIIRKGKINNWWESLSTSQKIAASIVAIEQNPISGLVDLIGVRDTGKPYIEKAKNLEFYVNPASFDPMKDNFRLESVSSDKETVNYQYRENPVKEIQKGFGDIPALAYNSMRIEERQTALHLSGRTQETGYESAIEGLKASIPFVGRSESTTLAAAILTFGAASAVAPTVTKYVGGALIASQAAESGLLAVSGREREAAITAAPLLLMSPYVFKSLPKPTYREMFGYGKGATAETQSPVQALIEANRFPTRTEAYRRMFGAPKGVSINEPVGIERILPILPTSEELFGKPSTIVRTDEPISRLVEIKDIYPTVRTEPALTAARQSFEQPELYEASRTEFNQPLLTGNVQSRLSRMDIPEASKFFISPSKPGSLFMRVITPSEQIGIPRLTEAPSIFAAIKSRFPYALETKGDFIPVKVTAFERIVKERPQLRDINYDIEAEVFKPKFQGYPTAKTPKTPTSEVSGAPEHGMIEGAEQYPQLTEGERPLFTQPKIKASTEGFKTIFDENIGKIPSVKPEVSLADFVRSSFKAEVEPVTRVSYKSVSKTSVPIFPVLQTEFGMSLKEISEKQKRTVSVAEKPERDISNLEKLFSARPPSMKSYDIAVDKTAVNQKKNTLFNIRPVPFQFQLDLEIESALKEGLRQNIVLSGLRELSTAKPERQNVILPGFENIFKMAPTPVHFASTETETKTETRTETRTKYTTKQTPRFDEITKIPPIILPGFDFPIVERRKKKTVSRKVREYQVRNPFPDLSDVIGVPSGAKGKGKSKNSNRNSFEMPTLNLNNVFGESKAKQNKKRTKRSK